MLLLPTFDPNNPVSGQFNLNLTGGYGKAVIYNESNSNLKFTFSNGYTSYVPAWVAVEYCFLDIPLTNPLVKYSTVSTVVTGSSSISQVAIEIYEASEKVGGTYPAALIRQVSADVTSSQATSVINDGNLAPTTFVEATQTGNASGSNVALGNDGSVIFAQFVSSVFTQLFKITPGATPTIQFGKGVNLHQVDNNGTDALFFHVNSNNYPELEANLSDVIQFSDRSGNALFYANGPTQGNSLQLGPGIVIQGSTGPGPTTTSNILGVSNPGGITQLQAHSVGNQVQILDKNGATLSTIDANGCINMVGKIQTVNGDTSGSMTIQEIFTGGSKWLIIKQNNYKQAGAAQQFTLTNTFTGPFSISNLGCGGMEVLQAGTKQTINVLTAIAAAGGSFTGQTNIQQASFGWCNTNINQIQSQGGYATAHTGVTTIEGY
jgi:hypothetical protein